jgi:hypothetical protein
VVRLEPPWRRRIPCKFLRNKPQRINSSDEDGTKCATVRLRLGRNG